MVKDNMKEIQLLNRKLSLLKNSRLATTTNMSFFVEKVKLYKDIVDLEKEIKSLGSGQ